MTTCEEVAELLKLPLSRTAKSIMIVAGDKVHMLLIRGDHMLNEVKVGKVPGSPAGAGQPTPRSARQPDARRGTSGLSASPRACH